MSLKTAGIHHITSFAGDPQGNVDFYAGVLGLRLIKKTINFDAPEVYHLYFGNEEGSPGTIITFFPAPGTRKGKIGGGQVGITTYVVPLGSLDYWENRLHSLRVSFTKATRFGESFIQFRDNEGLHLELVEREEGPVNTWTAGGVPTNKAIKGFGGAVLYSADSKHTQGVLENVLGMTPIGEDADAGYIRYQTTGDLGNLIDIPVKDVPWGNGGAGTVHHIAWRAQDDTEHQAWNEWVRQHGFGTSGIVDRQYFNAVYFREQGGILFEIATDPPGFTVDEELNELGHKLMLPEWYEPQRAQIESNLIPIEPRVLKQDESV
ncbi:ring-cleaving dioxygenase [Paenibacillus polymyxa]|uniref:ring-cleaving dioxygenase n=1 Tax=Paenibacillus polymyxa TaxID=1406 RepID=UPI0005ECE24E|nr:ring-cleaving dioxygenase [Paenibacillus polymyxa]KJK28900.1 ring-cleaving dioxygenase [Paenibacillus polymyxa]